MPSPTYVGRFAPSPTGPLHVGSLVAALAAWLDARAHGGVWLVRIEDVDTTRNQPGADRFILRQLEECGLQPDAPPLWQSTCTDLYDAALARLIAQGDVYACGCSRSAVLSRLRELGREPERGAELVYPGTCRDGLHGAQARAWRLRLPDDKGQPLRWFDRRLGRQAQVLSQDVGDFVLRRADGPWAYQLAVVVDDAEQGITDVVRGEDLAGSTARQIALQRLLGLPEPRYLHTPLVLAANGEKLSKQNQAEAFLPGAEAVREALGHLAMPQGGRSLSDLLTQAVDAWKSRWVNAPNVAAGQIGPADG